MPNDFYSLDKRLQKIETQLNRVELLLNTQYSDAEERDKDLVKVIHQQEQTKAAVKAVDRNLTNHKDTVVKELKDTVKDSLVTQLMRKLRKAN